MKLQRIFSFCLVAAMLLSMVALAPMSVHAAEGGGYVHSSESLLVSGTETSTGEAQSESAAPTLTVDSATAEIGDVITLNATVSATTYACYGLQIVFDKTALELTAIKRNADNSLGYFIANAATGKVVDMAFGGRDADVEGVIFTMTFKVLTAGEHTVHLEIDSFNLSDQSEVEITAIDGVISSGSGSGSGGTGTEDACLVITQQPVDAEAALGEIYSVTVEAEGEGLKYQWYFRNAGSDKWHKSSVRTNTYTNVMTKARAGREVYCVITDALGNTVTTDIVKLIRVPKEELQIVTKPVSDEAALGEIYSVTVEAQGEGLKYQWYFRNAGSDRWHKSSVRTDTYTNVMTKARAGREVYCVITDALGNEITTDIVKLIRVPKEELQIVTQPVSDEAALGEIYSVTVEAQGEGLKYQWYFRNAGSDKWHKSSVRTNTYTNVMTKARAGREVYCVITDALGNQITTEIVTIHCN